MLADLSYSELQSFVKKMGLPAFRADQLFDAIYSAKSISEISNLPKGLKSIIEEQYPKYEIFHMLKSKDGTMKFIISYPDKAIVECVLMKYKYGYSICLSTQVGCRMGCKFCASTIGGLARNLTAGEILGQLLLVNRYLGGSKKERKITNIVLMGSGEPLDNYDNVVKFIRLASSVKGLNISERNISLSTCGLVDKIYKLAQEDFNITLTISLHASADEERAQIMPIAKRYSIKEIIDACRNYYNKTKRKIYFEYTLIKDVNDSSEDVKRLRDLTKGLLCHFNIIVLNEVAQRPLKKTTRLFAYQFVDLLKKEGVSATVRRTMGEDIEGACGQLRNKILANS